MPPSCMAAGSSLPSQYRLLWRLCAPGLLNGLMRHRLGNRRRMRPFPFISRLLSEWNGLPSPSHMFSAPHTARTSVLCPWDSSLSTEENICRQYEKQYQISLSVPINWQQYNQMRTLYFSPTPLYCLSHQSQKFFLSPDIQNMPRSQNTDSSHSQFPRIACDLFSAFFRTGFQENSNILLCRFNLIMFVTYLEIFHTWADVLKIHSQKVRKALLPPGSCSPHGQTGIHLPGVSSSQNPPA